MRKTFAWLLAFALMLAPAAVAAPGNLAVATTQVVEVDGKAVRFETYALLDENGFQTNYAKLRDVASVLDGTEARFSVAWSAREGISVTTGRSYTADGTEMRTPYSGDRTCQRLAETTAVDGAARNIAAIRLYDDDGNGYTYYKLRDLGQYLGFRVDWSAERGVFVETDKLYSGISRAELAPLVGRWRGTLDLSGVMAGVAGKNRELADYLRFNKAEAAAGARVLKTCNAAGGWQMAGGKYRLAGGDGADLPCALSDGGLKLTVDEGLVLSLTKD